MRLEAILGCLAHEADQRKSAWAQHLLVQLCSYERLVLAGLLADLSSMHRQWVRESDVHDPNVEDVARCDERFLLKLGTL